MGWSWGLNEGDDGGFYGINSRQRCSPALVIQYSPISPMKALSGALSSTGRRSKSLMIVIILLVSKKM